MLPERNRWRLAVGIGVALVLALVVVAARGERSGAGTLALNYAPLVTATPAPTPVVVGGLPGGASPGSALVMVQGIVDRRLVVWPLAQGGTPREVDRHVKPWLLVPDPSGTHLIYRTDNALMMLDVPAQRAQIVAELPDDSTIQAVQWSPEGDALAFVVEAEGRRTARYVWLAGDRDPVVMFESPPGLPVDVAWLADGRPVVIALGIGPVGGLEAYNWLFDPATGDAVPLPPDTPLVMPWAPWRSPDGQYQLYTLTSTDKSFSSGACRTGALLLAGEEWVYLAMTGTSKAREMAFMVPNVILDGVLWMPDGRVLMRGVAEEGCAPGATGIYLARLGEKPQQIVQTGPFVTKEDDNAIWGAAFDLSPDRMLVAWAKNDVTAGQAGIYLTPVDGGDPARLFVSSPLDGDAAPFAFEDTQAILDFVWLP